MTAPDHTPGDLPLHAPVNASVNAPVAQEESLIPYPSAFPIKVMGVDNEAFVEAVVAVVVAQDPLFDTATIERRASSSGKYVGLTVTVTATSREQLDQIYRGLSGHPLVKYVL
jgi:putative lipoic acid-binding regulatory protein